MEEYTPQQNLRMSAINDAMSKGYCRHGDYLMVRVYTPDGRATSSWRPAITIEDYARSLTSTPDDLIVYLKHSDDPEIPWID